MKRDTVKTLAGLVVIAAIVVATFAYGNAQRQNQLRHDQDVKKQQEAKATNAVPSASSSATPSKSPSKSNGVAANTAPVKSPTSNNIQGSQQQAAAGGAAAGSGSSATSGQVASAQSPNIPQTGGTGASAPLPDTGSPLEGFVGFAAVVTAWLWLRRSKRSLFQAARRY